jgi:hypothetical protein
MIKSLKEQTAFAIDPCDTLRLAEIHGCFGGRHRELTGCLHYQI